MNKKMALAVAAAVLALVPATANAASRSTTRTAAGITVTLTINYSTSGCLNGGATGYKLTSASVRHTTTASNRTKMNGGSWKIGAGGLSCSSGFIDQDPGTVRTLSPLGSLLTRTDTANTGFTKYIVPGGSFGLDGAGGAWAKTLTRSDIGFNSSFCTTMELPGFAMPMCP